MSVASNPTMAAANLGQVETAEAILRSAAKSAAEILYSGPSVAFGHYGDGFTAPFDSIRAGVLLDLCQKLSGGNVTVMKEPDGWRVGFTSLKDPNLQARLQQAPVYPQLGVAIERAIVQLVGQAFPREYAAHR